MKLSELRDALAQFERATGSLIPLESCNWRPSVDAHWLDERADSISGRFGVYVCAAEDDEILYIGKAQDSPFEKRIWGHLQKPDPGRSQSGDRRGLKLYPNHKWKDQGLDAKAVETVEKGELTIEALELQPNHVAGLFEIVALTWCQQEFGQLPPLNRKLG